MPETATSRWCREWERIYCPALGRRYCTNGTSTSDPSLSLQQISKTRARTWGGMVFLETVVTSCDIGIDIRSSRRSGRSVGGVGLNCREYKHHQPTVVITGILTPRVTIYQLIKLAITLRCPLSHLHTGQWGDYWHQVDIDRKYLHQVINITSSYQQWATGELEINQDKAEQYCNFIRVCLIHHVQLKPNMLLSRVFLSRYQNQIFLRDTHEQV